MHPWPDCVKEIIQIDGRFPPFWRGKPSRYPNSFPAIGLEHGQSGGRHTKQTPRPPPKSSADSCHIHPWIFSPPLSPGFFPHSAPSCRCVSQGLWRAF
jgi:hypothetical protein